MIKDRKSKDALNYLAFCFEALILGLSVTGCVLDTDRALSSSPAVTWNAPEAAVHSPAPSTMSPAEMPEKGETAEPGIAVQPEPKDLTALLDEALSNNPSTQKSWFNAKVAAAQKIEAYSIYYPSVSVAENFQRQRIETIGFPFSSSDTGAPSQQSTSIIQTRTSYGPMLDISYTLFTFGAQSSQAAAAREALFAANFQFNRDLQNMVLATQRAYYLLHAAEAAVAAEESSIKDARAALEAAETKNQVGLSPIQDVLKAKSNLLEEQYRLEALKSSVETARANLAQVLGRTDVNSVRIKAPEIQAAPPETDARIKDLIDLALAQRPDLQSAYAALRSQENQNSAAKSSLLPKLVGGLSGDITKLHGFAGTEDNYLAFIRLQWDIFDGFNKEAKVIETKSKMEAAKRDVKTAELAAIGDVWTQYHSFLSAREKLSSAQALVSASEATFLAIETGYKTGLNSILDFLSAQRDLANARLVLITAQSDYTTSIARLANAVGDIPQAPAVKAEAGPAQ